ncbi:MAG: helix-turn-helix domain-containing protein [Clostridia bacterium]|nr:helix-turn-helix domain-containing protein [Clostridia bacterium]
MANIRRINNKDKETYQITVSAGRNVAGKQIRQYMTWSPPDGMTPKKVEKELARISFEFENKVQSGEAHDDGLKFSEFAERWYKEFATKQLKPKTCAEYRKMLVRINAAIGHIKLRDLRTAHINSFLSNLQEDNIRTNKATATAKGQLLRQKMKELKMTGVAVSQKTDISPNTITAAARGVTVALDTAQRITGALNVKLNDYFSVQNNMKPLSPETVRAYHRAISSILGRATEWGYIQNNPATKCILPKTEKRESAYLDEPDARHMLELLRKEPILWRAMITFDLLSGLRRGELLGLRWQDVNFEDQTITVRQTSNYLPQKGVYVGTPKTDTSHRPLHLSKSAFSLLVEYKQWQDEQKELTGQAWGNQDGRIFTNEIGVPLFPDSITKWFSGFVKRSRLPKVTVHSLRHTFASLMIADGAPLVVVSNALGHAQSSTTANIYSHVLASAAVKAAQTFDKFNDIVSPEDQGGTITDIKNIV